MAPQERTLPHWAAGDWGFMSWAEAVGTERSPLSASPAREVTGVSLRLAPQGRTETQAGLDEAEAAVQLWAPGRGAPSRVPQCH